MSWLTKIKGNNKGKRCDAMMNHASTIESSHLILFICYILLELCLLQVFDGRYTATADVTININDVNDNAPQFEQHFYQVSISKTNNNNEL